MARLKVGVIGCGAIAQVWHLPHLREHSPEFEIRALCDLSHRLLAAVGDEYGVPPGRRYTDYREMVQSDVEAVIVCPSASHAEPSIEYPHDRRAICSWVDLPELWEFTETFEVYGSRDRVRVSFPSGFARGMMSTVNVHGMEADGRPWRKELIFHDNPFRLELLHFRQCVLEGKQPITPGRDAVADIKLVADIVRAYLDRRP